MAEAGLARLETDLGHKFADPSLLDRALTHRSVSPEPTARGALSIEGLASATGDNEQLEFLGDAVLGMLVSEELLRAFPDWSEGQLSKSRARLVNESSLAAVAQQLELGRYLRLGRGEEKTGGREKPALLADALEAVVAAIYLDGGIETARAFVNRAVVAPALEAEALSPGRSDHKSALQELLQAGGLGQAEYRVVEESGPDHRKMFRIEVHALGVVAAGSGRTKKEAEQSAARSALEQLSAKRAEE
ncbi:MAG: ribonuclease III [Candidatus Acidiferrales bacterium]|jgi:ribonuclease-3